jgi:hypothetical protein
LRRLEKAHFLKKSGRWAKTAFSINNANHYALSMFVRLYQEECPEYIGNSVSLYLQVPSRAKSPFYPRAVLLKAKTPSAPQRTVSICSA